MESDANAKCHVEKFKDNIWLKEPGSFERVRIYFEVTEGEICGFRLIVPSMLVRFFRNVSQIAELPEEKGFMRCDIEEKHVPIKVKGSSQKYTDTNTEIVLRFPKSLKKGKYVLIFDLYTDAYRKSDRWTHLLTGFSWKYISKNYFYEIKKEDTDFVVVCKKIESWIVPPHPGRIRSIKPDRHVNRESQMSEQAITILGEKYLIPEPGPVDRPVFQWEVSGEFGFDTPSMMSRVDCSLAIGSPLVLGFSILGLLALVISLYTLMG